MEEVMEEEEMEVEEMEEEEMGEMEEMEMEEEEEGEGERKTTLAKGRDQPWWYICIIPGPRRLKQDDMKRQRSPSLHSNTAAPTTTLPSWWQTGHSCTGRFR